uniref:signal-recognition-particle GTPase n=1 Tax=Tanacetum cinerariifolium TaxID=118510 RepID=A0A6L2LFJ4_TANCI|nr:signal recognition particle 54 kDa protein 2 [Tanacetum cinerariifolium]
MVLGELGGSIRRALQAMSNATIIDEQVLNECLKEITRALLQHNVHVKLVHKLQTNIKNIVNLPDLAAGHNKRKIIQQLRPRLMCPYNLGMILGSGKTTTCTKYAYHHQKKGWKPALVCADTFRAGAFDQLKQNATKAKIPFYGSHTESDPLKIAVKGVETFKKKNCDLIIIDTSGIPNDGIFEILQKPDLVIFVMDSSIGQAAFDQAQAFKESVAVGAVIITEMDGHAKGGGALSAVAATKSPVIYIGTGEHMDDFKVFDVKPFVSGLLARVLQKLSEGNFTLRIMYEQYHNILEMGPIDQLASILPGFNAELMPKGQEKESQEKESQAKIKRYMTMMDSMTNEELDSTNPKLMNESRIMLVDQVV